MRRGYVYILSNESMPGLFKIGKTRRDPAQRASELYQTGVPTPFRVEHSVLTPDCDDLEYTLHQIFEVDRVSPDREFFTTDLFKIRCEMDSFQRLQVEKIVGEFLPDHVVLDIDYLIDPTGFNHSFYREIDGFSLSPIEISDILHQLKGEEIRPALKRYRKLKEEMRAERKSTDLKVVKNG